MPGVQDKETGEEGVERVGGDCMEGSKERSKIGGKKNRGDKKKEEHNQRRTLPHCKECCVCEALTHLCCSVVHIARTACG